MKDRAPFFVKQGEVAVSVRARGLATTQVRRMMMKGMYRVALTMGMMMVGAASAQAASE